MRHRSQPSLSSDKRREMYTTVSLYVSIFNILHCCHVGRGSEFSAISDLDERYLSRIYLREWSLDPPSTLDPATTSASTRLRICEEIGRSGAFEHYGLEPIDIRGARAILPTANYLDLLHLLYIRTTDSQTQYDYTNSYQLHKFKLARFNRGDQLAELFGEPSSFHYKKEYVFFCPFKDKYSDDIALLCVSKAYGLRFGLHSHRFAFLSEGDYHRLMLVEKSAETYTRPDFNVELHYLELRKRHRPAPTCEEDPVCKLNLGRYLDNQSFRLCTIALRSSHFRNLVSYPRRIYYNFYYWGTVSFKTEEGMAAANGRRYSERMTQCASIMRNGYMKIYYISRAYNPYQVFVYTQDEARDIYLEALVTDVCIVHERYSFGEVET